MFTSLGITALEYLCPNLHTISKSFLKIPDNLAGLTILAFGNSAPDIFGTYEAIKMEMIHLALAELIGAALFISTCVVGCIGIVQPFKVPQLLFRRDVAMYCTICTLILVSFLMGKLTRVISMILVSVYVCYVAVAIYSHKMQQSRINAILRDRRSRGEFGDVVDDDDVAIDEVYLDEVSQLPTIDDVNLGDNLGVDTSATGNFGLRKLMQDLSLHSNLGGAIQLDTERQLMSISVEGIRGEEEDISQVDNSRVNQFLNLFCPQLSHFKELHTGEKLKHLLLLPISIALKMSTPVRDHASILTIEQDYKPNTAHNVFHYSQDRLLLTVQAGLGNLFFFLVNTNWSISSKIIILPLISVGVGDGIFRLYPSSTSAHFAQRMKIINYFTAIFGLVVSITRISIIAAEIINILQVVSTAYHLSDDVLGITLFALGNSVGDFITNYTIARMGYPIMAFAACFGSPLMALCSFGFSGLIIGSSHALVITPTLFIGIVALFCNMAILSVLVPKNSWNMDKKVGTIIIMNWFVTCLLCLLVEFIRH